MIRARERLLDTPRRREFNLRCWVMDNFDRARTRPVEGVPVSYKEAATQIKVVCPQALHRMAHGRLLPRYRKAIKIAPWIEGRLKVQAPLA